MGGYEAETWYGLYAPRGTPIGIIKAINAVFKTVLESSEVKARLTSIDVEPLGSSPEYLHDYLAYETVKWANIMKASGIQP